MEEVGDQTTPRSNSGQMDLLGHLKVSFQTSVCVCNLGPRIKIMRKPISSGNRKTGHDFHTLSLIQSFLPIAPWAPEWAILSSIHKGSQTSIMLGIPWQPIVIQEQSEKLLIVSHINDVINQNYSIPFHRSDQNKENVCKKSIKGKRKICQIISLVNLSNLITNE